MYKWIFFLVTGSIMNFQAVYAETAYRWFTQNYNLPDRHYYTTSKEAAEAACDWYRSLGCVYVESWGTNLYQTEETWGEYNAAGDLVHWNPVRFHKSVYPDYPGIDRNKNVGTASTECLNSESDGKGNSGGSPLVGNPIHARTGNKLHIDTLYVSNGLSPLTFSLIYNSDRPRIGPLGSAWKHSYEISIDVDELSGNANVNMGDGKYFTYRAIGVNEWVTDADVKINLEQNTLGWTVRDSIGRQLSFDNNGRLKEIKTERGKTQYLTYASNKLVTVRDELGNSLYFTYYKVNNGATGAFYGRLASVEHISSGRKWGFRYNSSKDLEFIDNPDGTTRKYLYENTKFVSALTGIIDERNIRYATYAYDNQGRALSSEHAGGVNKTLLVFNSDGTTTVTNSRNVNTIYSFINQYGVPLVSNISGPGCSTCGSGDSSYDYDPANSNLLSKTINGVTTEYGNYDSNGNPGYIIEALGTTEQRRTDYTYDPRFVSKVKTITEPSVYPAGNKVTTYDYDDFGNTTLIRISGFNPDGTAIARETTLQYLGPLNQLSQIDGPRTDVNDITSLEYYPDDPVEGNNRARLKSITIPIGVVRNNIQYSATGKVLSETRANGVTVTYTYYPGNDRLETMTESAAGISHTTHWTYLATGEVETITRGDGSTDATTLTFGYDAARRLIRITDGLGNYIQYTLDTEGNEEKQDILDDQNVLHKSLSQTFDDYNRLNLFTQANESSDSDFAVDGTLDKVTDGKGTVTDYSYDALKRLVTITQDLGGTDTSARDALTQYGYDIHSNLTAVIDPNNGNTAYVYDDLGNLLSQTSPDTGRTSLTHDDAGNVLTRIDAKGQNFIYSYDALNRLTTLDAPGSADDIIYAYDSCTNGVGRLCSVAIGDGFGNNTVSYSYDAFGNVSAHQGISYGYDNAGRIKTIAYPSGNVVAYSYDAAGQVNQIDLERDGQIINLASNITYAPFGPVTGLSYGNGHALSQGVDTAYRFTDHTVIGALELVNSLYDANGNLNQVDDRFSTASNIYNYDVLNRLDKASGSFGNQDFSYDKNGNRLQLLQDGNTFSYGYESNSNRLDVATNDDIILDANGNTLSDGRHSYIFDAHNRLISVDTDVAHYQYNALGQRVAKIVGQKESRFIYDLNGQLIAETDNTGRVKREYIHVNGQVVAMYELGDLLPVDAVYDNTGNNISFNGAWISSTSIAGYEGTDYQHHAANGLAPAHTIIDNGSPEFSVTGTWPTSISVAGFEGSDYQHHYANGPSPDAQTADNDNGSATGSWPTSTSVAGFEGANYQHHSAGTGSNTFTWSAGVASTGTYEVFARWTAHANRASNATYTINHVGGSTPVTVNQQANGGSWNLLGSFELDANSTVVLSDAADGYVIADAIQVAPQNAAPNTATWQINAAYGGEFKVYAKWTAHANRASNATYMVHHAGGTTPVTVNQQSNGGEWNLLGSFTLDSNSKVILNDDANGYVIADAIAYVPATALPNQVAWTPNLPGSGQYQVYAKWTAHANRASNATYTVEHVGGNTPVTVNQQTNGGVWNLLGTFTLDSSSRVVLTDQADGYVIADAIRIVSTEAITNDPKVYYVHTDHLGSPRAVTDAAKTVVWRWNSDPFGTTAANEDPDGDGNALTFNLRFPGQYYDSETGLHYNYFRYYDPRTGRYITSDPIGLAGGLNTYGYVGENPVKWIDPLGLEVQLCRAPAQILGGMVDHHWIKTDTKEAGAQGQEDNPGDQYEAPYITDLYIRDHSGDSENREGASCETVKNVDEDKVNELLDIGKKLGGFSTWNNCQSFAADVLRQSRITRQTRRGRR